MRSLLSSYWESCIKYRKEAALRYSKHFIIILLFLPLSTLSYLLKKPFSVLLLVFIFPHLVWAFYKILTSIRFSVAIPGLQTFPSWFDKGSLKLKIWGLVLDSFKSSAAYFEFFWNVLSKLWTNVAVTHFWILLFCLVVVYFFQFQGPLVRY